MRMLCTTVLYERLTRALMLAVGARILLPDLPGHGMSAPPERITADAMVEALGPALRQAYAWGVRQQFNRPAMVCLLSQIGVDDLLRPDELETLTMPVSLLWGWQDRILPRAHLELFRRHLPASAAWKARVLAREPL